MHYNRILSIPNLLLAISLTITPAVNAQEKPSPSQTNTSPSKIQQAPKQAIIDKAGTLILVRGTLTALDHANKTGNYTTFRDLGAPSFILANDPTKLSEIFNNLRKGGVDLSGVLVQEPSITALETVNNGMLHITGYFPSGIGQLNFELLYVPMNRQWKLFGIAANTGPSGPVAPTELPPEAPPIQKKLN